MSTLARRAVGLLPHAAGVPVAAFAFAVLAALAVPVRAEVDDPAARTRVTTLPNGLTVLSVVDDSTPVVSFQVWVKVGSKDEAYYTGIAHLFEHMMFRGTDALPPEEHERLIQARGGRINAFTSRDVTVYHEDVSPDTLPLVIALEAERIANLTISEESLDSEREVVLEERRMRTEDQPQGRAFEALFALAYRAHPYRVPPIGWRSDVEAVTVEACRSFFATYYSPNNIVLSVVGSFDEEETLARIREAFGDLEPAAVIPRNPTKEPVQEGERRETVHFDVRAPLMGAIWHAPATGDADAEPLDILSLILSGGRSSRLYRSLVYDAQLALAAQGSYFEMQEAGVFYAFASVRPGADVDEVERLFMAEIARVRDELVPESELAKAKRQIEVDLVGGLDTAHSLASRIAQEWVTFGRIRSIDERLAAFRAVTAEDVQRVARKYLRDDGRSVVHVTAPTPAEAAIDAKAQEAAP